MRDKDSIHPVREEVPAEDLKESAPILLDPGAERGLAKVSTRPVREVDQAVGMKASTRPARGEVPAEDLKESAPILLDPGAERGPAKVSTRPVREVEPDVAKGLIRPVHGAGQEPVVLAVEHLAPAAVPEWERLAVERRARGEAPEREHPVVEHPAVERPVREVDPVAEVLEAGVEAVLGANSVHLGFKPWPYLCRIGPLDFRFGKKTLTAMA